MLDLSVIDSSQSLPGVAYVAENLAIPDGIAAVRVGGGQDVVETQPAAVGVRCTAARTSVARLLHQQCLAGVGQGSGYSPDPLEPAGNLGRQLFPVLLFPVGGAFPVALSAVGVKAATLPIIPGEVLVIERLPLQALAAQLIKVVSVGLTGVDPASTRGVKQEVNRFLCEVRFRGEWETGHGRPLKRIKPLRCYAHE